MSADHDDYSTCNEEEDEAIQETPLEADSLLDGGTVIPETLLDDLIVGQKSDDDRSAVDSDSNQSFPPLGETIGTVVAESIPEMLDGSARCLHHRPLLNDAELESLIMEQQHRSLRYDGLSTSTLIHRQPLLGRQWSITNPVIGRQMHQSTEEANALVMLNSPVRLEGNNTMGDSAPIYLSPLRVAATVDGTSVTIHGDSNNNIDTTNNNVNIAVADNVQGTGNGARTKKKRNASATDGVAAAKPARTRKRKSPSSKEGTSNKSTRQRKNNTKKTSAAIAVERGYSIPWTPSPTTGRKDASTQTPDYGVESYVAPRSRLQLVANTDDEGNDANTDLLGDRCCYMCGQSPCEWDTIGALVLQNVQSEYDVQSAPEHGYVLRKSTGEKVTNNKIRFISYKLFIAEKYGHLGRGNRIRCKPCVEDKIRQLFPDMENNYTGFTAGEE